MSLTPKRWWGVSADGKGRGEQEENEVPGNLAFRKGIITEWQGPRECNVLDHSPHSYLKSQNGRISQVIGPHYTVCLLQGASVHLKGGLWV